MRLNDVKIVLCHAAEGGNVGAICRVMKNMGLSQLRLASPQPLLLEKIYERAVNSWDIWEKARIFNSLSEAVADCSVIIGTTCRRGRHRKSISMTPRALAAWLADRPGPAAVVFGNERTGLEREQLNLCNLASHIPVSPAQPSLNLSHAVQIYAYELFLALEQQLPVKCEWNSMNQTEISSLVGSITDTLADVGFYKYPNREMQERFLLDVFSRAGLSAGEGKYFKNILVKAARINKED